jgi:hypothetical protein
MPIIRCTSRLLAEIDDSPMVDSAAIASSPIRDWYGNIFAVERRKCILFINEPTLFVCLAIGVTKSDYRQIVPCFLNLLERTLRQEGFNEDEIAWVLGLHKNMAVDRTQDRSTIASLSNRVSNAKCIIQWDGGLGNCDVAALTHLLNNTPMKPIRYSNGLEQMKRLVDQKLFVKG